MIKFVVGSKRCVLLGVCCVEVEVGWMGSLIIYFVYMKKYFVFFVLVGVFGSVFVVDIVGNVKVVENKVFMCIGCYGIFGYKVSYFEVYQVLMLGGQFVKYIENVLCVYQKGECKYFLMMGVVVSLLDQDIVDLVVYYLQQK